MSVEGTPFDFRTPALVGDGLKSDNQYIKNSNGYDHNFVLDKEDGVFDKDCLAYLDKYSKIGLFDDITCAANTFSLIQSINQTLSNVY